MSLAEPLKKVARRLPEGVRTPLRALWSRALTLREAEASGWNSRLRSYTQPQQPGLLSFVTTVWNTPPVYLNALAKSVFEQAGGTNFEWFILDNGTHDPATRAAMRKIASHRCVRFERVEHNLGIIGGMRYCLERAKGRYILPLDSDDLLSPDCVRILTTMIVENGYPALLYSDEDKLIGDAHLTAYHKPDWDPVLFLHSCYIAHLCALNRELALKYDCYTDAAAEGSHDWDSFTRFHLAGHKPVHVPEIIYSWRMHQNSTSSNIDAKPVVYSSQEAVLRRFVGGTPGANHFDVVKSQLFGGTPDWWIKRRHEPEGALPLTTLVVTEGRGGRRRPKVEASGYPGHTVKAIPRSQGLEGLADALEGVEGLVHLISEDVRIEEPEWAWEALGLMEMFPDTVAVGGRILNADRRILHAGGFFGFGRGCDAPDRWRPPDDPGYFAAIWKPHSASVVSAQHAVFRAEFLRPLLRGLEQEGVATYGYLGAWAGAAARRQGARTIYTPFLLGVDARDWEAEVSDQERAAFLRANADLVPETGLMSQHVGFSPTAPFCRASPAERARHRHDLLAWAEAVLPG